MGNNESKKGGNIVSIWTNRAVINLYNVLENTPIIQAGPRNQSNLRKSFASAPVELFEFGWVDFPRELRDDNQIPRTHRQIVDNFKRDYFEVPLQQLKLDNNADIFSTSQAASLVDIVIDREDQLRDQNNDDATNEGVIGKTPREIIIS